MIRVNQKGFTLVELLVVITIIGILTTVGMISYQGTLKSARDAQRKNDLKVVQYALAEWKQDHPTTAFSSLDDSANTFAQLVTNLRANNYLKKAVSDPRNVTPYAYSYIPDDANDTFILRACLENSGDAQGTTPTASECVNGTNKKYEVSRP